MNQDRKDKLGRIKTLPTIAAKLPCKQDHMEAVTCLLHNIGS